MSGCSTVLEGSSQRISVSSVPSGASCVLKANDDIIAQVESTPAVITVQKSKYDIIVECSKDGYLKGKNRDHSDYAISTVTNAVFGQFGIVGSMMDNATGAGSKYDSQVIVQLEKAPAQAAEPAMAHYIIEEDDPAPVAAATPAPIRAEPLPIYQLTDQQIAQLVASQHATTVQNLALQAPQSAIAPVALNETTMNRLPPYDVIQ